VAVAGVLHAFAQRDEQARPQDLDRPRRFGQRTEAHAAGDRGQDPVSFVQPAVALVELQDRGPTVDEQDVPDLDIATESYPSRVGPDEGAERYRASSDLVRDGLEQPGPLFRVEGKVAQRVQVHLTEVFVGREDEVGRSERDLVPRERFR
jgi:hypothetical protein